MPKSILRIFGKVYRVSFKSKEHAKSVLGKKYNTNMIKEEFALKTFNKMELFGGQRRNEVLDHLIERCKDPFIVKHYFYAKFFYDKSIEESLEPESCGKKILNFFCIDPKWALTIGMELIYGPDLQKFIYLTAEKEHTDLTVNEKFKCILQVASGLSWLHTNEIMHRDIKPANIILDVNNNRVIIFFSNFIL